MKNIEDVQLLLQKYICAKEETDRAKKEQEALVTELKEMLEDIGEPIKTDKYTVALQNRETISFDTALLPYLKTNGLETYVQETIDSSGLKKAISSSKILAEQIKVFTLVKRNKILVLKKTKK